jgi:hypothetical protein
VSPRPETARVDAPVPATPEDVAAVVDLLGREPQAEFEVVVRRVDGAPVVLRNAPLLRDGTPMPTRFWLVDPELNRLVGAVEAEGGVRAADTALDPAAIEATHRAYAAERDAALPPDHVGPRPSGGVGGTRRGVKCLHAHYANLLAGAADPVGAWTEAAIDALVDEGRVP